MKNLKYLLTTLFLIICFLPIKVCATGGISVSTSNLTIEKGSLTNFTITANNAAGRVDISTSNPNIANISATNLWLDTQSNSIIVKGNSVGTATITVVATDVTTYDGENVSGKKYVINVTVNEPKINSDISINTNTNANNNGSDNNLSTNNKLKEISIDGQKLIKVDDNNYTLVVSNSVSKINIKATVEDSKAKLEGAGSHDLNVGENNIILTVTSESNEQNKVNIKVTRKDGNYLEDIDNILKEEKNKKINIIVKENSKITSGILKNIKNSGKIVSFDFYNSDKKLLYSWQLEGSKINDTISFTPKIAFNSEYTDRIETLSNYADGLYVHFEHEGKLPVKSKIKLYVGNKYKDGNIINIYYFNEKENKLEIIGKNLKIKNGYIEFYIDHCSDYFLTRSKIQISTSDVVKVSSKISPIIYISIVTGIILLIIVIIILFSKKKKNLKEQNKDIDKIIFNSEEHNVDLNNSDYFSEKSSDVVDIKEDLIENNNNTNYVEQQNKNNDITMSNSNNQEICLNNGFNSFSEQNNNLKVQDENTTINNNGSDVI